MAAELLRLVAVLLGLRPDLVALRRMVLGLQLGMRCVVLGLKLGMYGVVLGLELGLRGVVLGFQLGLYRLRHHCVLGLQPLDQRRRGMAAAQQSA